MSSDCESLNDWTFDKIDLDKKLVDLHSVINDRYKLTNALFDYLDKDELREIFHNFKNKNNNDLDIEYLKKICLEELEQLPKKKIMKLIDLELDGKEADINWSEEDSNKEEENENKKSSDDIQMNVDDEEYEEFLNAEFNNNNDLSEKEEMKEKKSKPKIEESLSKKDKQKLINELAFPSAAEGEILDHCKIDSSQNEASWQNLWNQTQQEIQELKMKADAIKVMMQRSKKSSPGEELYRNSNNLTKIEYGADQLLDNIESDDDYVSVEEELESGFRSSLAKKSPTEKDNGFIKEQTQKYKRNSLNCDCEKETVNGKFHQKNYAINKHTGQRKEHNSEDRRKDYYKQQIGHHSDNNIHNYAMKKSDDEERQIEEAIKDEFLDIKVMVRESHKSSKMFNKKLEEDKLSMESGEIVDDEDDFELLKEPIQEKNRKIRSPSFTSSIDSFGRQRRKRRSKLSLVNSDSFSSLDEVLREVELEEQMGKSSKSKIDRVSTDLYSNQSKFLKYHRHKSKKLCAPE